MKTKSKYSIAKKTYTISPFSAVFPPMQDEEYTEFEKHIRDNGIKDPVIYVDPRNGAIIEGRHRVHACEAIGSDDLQTSLVFMPAPIEPPVTDHKIREFVLAKNMHRRHLSVGQRAMIAASIANIDHKTTLQNLAKAAKGEEIEGITTTQAGKAMGVSPRAVKQAKRVAKNAPDLKDKVLAGEMSLNAADTETSNRTGGSKGKNKRAAPAPAPAPAESQEPDVDEFLSSLGDTPATQAAPPPAAVTMEGATPLAAVLKYIKNEGRTFSEINQILAAAQAATSRIADAKVADAKKAPSDVTIGSEDSLLGEMLGD